jgi:hypothetical protein
MPTTLPHVRPGDLITAEHWNDVLDWLADLQAIVDGLGVGGSVDGPPLIIDLQPSDQAPIGSELLLIGSGFGVAVENTVTIANITAAVLGGGGAQLRVRVPIVPGVPPGGTPTQITVSNPRGFTTHAMRVMPAVLTMPEGQLFSNLTTSPPATDEATTADFIFTVRAVVNIAETYTLTPLLTPDAAPAQWSAQCLDAALNPISTITIPAGSPPTGESRQVRVRVTIPPSTDGTSCGLSLTIRSQKNATLVATSPTFTIDVGGAPPVPEQLTVTRGAVQNGSTDPDGTVVVRPTTTRVTFSAAGTQNGVNYTVSPGTIPPGWTAAVVGGATQGATGTQLTFRIDFTPGASAATFNIRVSQSSDATVFGTLAQPVRPQ